MKDVNVLFRIFFRVNELLTPSFGMKVKSYEPESKIELEGKNNWNQLIRNYSILIIGISIILFLLYDFLWKSIVGRGFFLLLIYIVCSSCYYAFKSARNKKYIKEVVWFNKEGIYLNYLKGSPSGEFIKSDSLKGLKVIFNFGTYKFMLYGLANPYFQFVIYQSSFFEPENFLKDFSDLLGLELKNSAQLGQRFIFEFQEKQTGESLEKSEDEKVEMDLVNTSMKYKPQNFYQYYENNELVIKENSDGGIFSFPKKIRISKEKKLIQHKVMLIENEIIKFSEIRDFEFEINQKSDDHVSYVVGEFFVKTIDNKKRKLFEFKKRIDRQVELIEFEMLKDLEFLIETINMERNKS